MVLKLNYLRTRVVNGSFQTKVLTFPNKITESRNGCGENVSEPRSKTLPCYHDPRTWSMVEREREWERERERERETERERERERHRERERDRDKETKTKRERERQRQREREKKR